ncbi:MAG: hypothetical protein IT307_18795, partial [Chloroflexi bacterium]|nr:hypothetical protein [Chloroflexota bacterium]
MDEQSSSGPRLYGYSADVAEARTRSFIRRLKDATGEPWALVRGPSAQFDILNDKQPQLSVFVEPASADSCTIGADFADGESGPRVWRELQAD